MAIATNGAGVGLVAWSMSGQVEARALSTLQNLDPGAGPLLSKSGTAPEVSWASDAGLFFVSWVNARVPTAATFHHGTSTLSPESTFGSITARNFVPLVECGPEAVGLWGDERSGRVELMASRLQIDPTTRALSQIAVPRQVSVQGPVTSFTATTDGTHCLALWTEESDAGRSLVGRRLGIAGADAGSAFVVRAPTPRRWERLSAASSGPRSYAVVREETGSNPVLRGLLLSNEPPTLSSQALTTPEDTLVPVPLPAVDADGDPLTFSVTSPPTRGTLVGTPPSLSYRPPADQSGTDSFTLTANDGLVTSASATITITITPVNDPPIGTAQALTTPEDVPLTITLSGTDVEDAGLTFSISNDPTRGMLSGTPPQLTYTPRAEFNGTDSFTFTVNDGQADSAPTTVTLTVTPVNDAPIAESQTFTMPQRSLLPVELKGSDLEGTPLTFSIVSGPAHGTLTGTPPNVTYRPAETYFGPDRFTYQANDGALDSAPATIDVVVEKMNLAPTVQAQRLTLDEDTVASLTVVGTDPDDDPLTWTIVTQPSRGTLAVDGAEPKYTYTPDPDFSGSDAFTIKASDGSLESATVTISLTVAPVNDAPTARSFGVTAPQDQPVTVTLEGADPEASPLSFEVVSQPERGTLSGTPPSLTYTPRRGFAGLDRFTYVANDGATASAVATVEVTVLGTPRDTVQLNGWSCGCSQGSGSGAWLALVVGALFLGRRRQGLLAALALLTFPLAAQAATPTRSMAVPEVRVTVANEKLDASAFTEMLVAAADQSGLFKVISAAEVASLLGLERQRQLLGCSDESACVSELAGALGSDFVFEGTVGRVGANYLVAVRLLDAKQGKVIGRSSLQVADASLLLNAVWRAAQEALDAAARTLPEAEGKRWAERPRKEPAAAVAPASSRLGVAVSALGSFQPLAEVGSRVTVGGEVNVSWRISRFDLGAGVVISPVVGARLFVAFALLDLGPHRFSVSARGSGFPGAGVYGGGLGVVYELSFNRFIAAQAHVAGDVYSGGAPVIVAVLGGLGVAAHF